MWIGCNLAMWTDLFEVDCALAGCWAHRSGVRLALYGRILGLALVLSACRDRVRIHTEAPRVTEEVRSCTRLIPMPYTHTVFSGSGKNRSCHPQLGVHLVPVPGQQRARVTRTTYSWNYADAKPDEAAQLGQDVDVEPLESCR